MAKYFTYESASRDLAAALSPRREGNWLTRLRARVAIFREEMLRQMLGLPDARNVTAEQMAFRRKIQSEIASQGAAS